MFQTKEKEKRVNMKYTELLPFMEEDELKKIAQEIMSGTLKGVKVEALYPFIGPNHLHEIVDQLIEKKESRALEYATPFISKEKVLTIYRAAEKGDLPNFDASSCIPFLSPDMIKELFRELIKNAPMEADEEDKE